MRSAVPQKLRSGNAERKSVMNALMSSRPRRGSCSEYLSSMSGAAISSTTARLTFLPQNSVNQRPTTDGVSIVCPMCGEYDVASSVLATEQLQRLEPEERGKQGEAFGPAGRSPHDRNQLDRSGYRTRPAIGGRLSD